MEGKSPLLDYLLSFITSFLDSDALYEEYVIMGVFNANKSNPSMKTILNQHRCKNTIKNQTCYKSRESFLDLFITSRHTYTSFLKFLKQE